MSRIDKISHLTFCVSYLIIMTYIQDNYFDTSSRIERKTEFKLIAIPIAAVYFVIYHGIKKIIVKYKKKKKD